MNFSVSMKKTHILDVTTVKPFKVEWATVIFDVNQGFWGVVSSELPNNLHFLFGFIVFA